MAAIVVFLKLHDILLRSYSASKCNNHAPQMRMNICSFTSLGPRSTVGRVNGREPNQRDFTIPL